MERIELGGNELSFDAEAARAAYRLFVPHVCDCAGCRNFYAARDRFFRKSSIDLFARLGIDVNKEAEIYDIGPIPSEPGYVRYGGWFHLVGEIVNSGAPVEIESGLIVWFSSKLALVPQAFAGLRLVQLEIEARAPWVLGEPWAG